MPGSSRIIALGVSLALLSLASFADSIPGFKAQVLAEEDGRPQEWVRVEMSAYSTIRSIMGERDEYYLHDVLYFRAKDGIVAVPARSFTVRAPLVYKGWTVKISSPGHGPAVLKGTDVTSDGTDGCAVVLRLRRQNGFELRKVVRDSTLTGPPEFEGDFDSSHDVAAKCYFFMCQEYLLENWAEYYKGPGIAISVNDPIGDLAFYLGPYLVDALQFAKDASMLPEGKAYRDVPFLMMASQLCEALQAEYPRLFENERIAKRCAAVHEALGRPR